MGKTFKARRIVRGKAAAEAVVCPGGFSFLGDVDTTSGEIIASDNPNRGRTIDGKILIYETTKGSSGGCQVLITLARKSKAPAAIISVKPADYNLTEGAILSGVPFLCEPDGDIIREIRTGQKVVVDADAGTIEIPDQ